MYFVYGHLQTFCSLFAYTLMGFCVLPVFLPLLFYCKKINKIKTFCTVSLLFSVYIVQTFFALSVDIVKTFFFNISLTFSTVILLNLRRFCCHFMLSYLLYRVFSLNILQGLCSHFKRWKDLKFL